MNHDSGVSSDANEWFTPWRFAALLALGILAMYPGVVLGWKTFVYRDFTAYGYPVACYYRECFWRGELPLWNPLNNCGIPFLAQWATLVLYPLSLFYLLLPLPWSLSCFCLGHLLLAGIGMYFLVVAWTGNRWAAGVAGLAYAFNGFTLNCLMWPHYMAVLGWLPWVIRAVERAWQKGGRRILIAVALSSMQMLGGVPELILLTWLVLLVLWLIEWTQARGARRSMMGRFVLVIGLTAGLCAAQLLPFLDLLRCSQRGTGFGDSSWAMPGTGWANLLVPWFHCILDPHGVIGQKEQGVTSSYYLGIGVLVLAFNGAWHVRLRKIHALTFLAMAGLVLALGNEGYVFGWLRRIFPAIGFMRYPIKFVMLTVCLIPLLAGAGMSWLDTLDEKAWMKARRGLVWQGLTVFVLIGGILWFAHGYPSPEGLGKETWQSGLSRLALLALFLLLLAIRRKAGSFRTQVILGVLLLQLTWLDYLTHAPELNPQVSPAVFQAPLPALEPKPVYGLGRALIHPVAKQRFANFFLPTPTENLVAQRLGMMANLNLPEDLAQVAGFYSLCLREEEQVRERLYSLTNIAESPLADFLNVTQMSDPSNVVNWHARTNALPLATIGQRAVFLDPAETLRALGQPEWNPRLTVFLPPEIQSCITATNQTRARIVSAHFTAHREELETDADAPGLLVVAQAYYHCWQATVDNRRVAVWRANHAFQAIQVPAGRHRVVFVYRDWPFYIGAIMSGLTLIGCVMAWKRWPA